MDHIPLKHKRTTLERAEKFISKAYFSDINLQSKLYKEKHQVTSIQHFAAPDRIPYHEAIKGDYKPVSVGQLFGPVWSTHWFKIDIQIPVAWEGGEVHFLWNSGSEALVWIGDVPVQGLNQTNERNYYVLTWKLDPDNLMYTLYIEMACNHLFGISNMALVDPGQDKKTFTLSRVEIALFNRDAFSLLLDIESLHDMAKNLGEDQRGYQALYTVNSMINSIDLNDQSTWPKCQEMAKAFFRQRNGSSQHTVYAMGHAHIDTAWLWPCAETIRKCARSWSSSLRLMERWPEFVFMCSQAQQYAWVKEHYPSMWRDICKFVDKGQFVPVGGTWVEMDGNIPSGEAIFRQFLYGQKFFKQEFGVYCKEFWLPDTFGYSGQFPQILQHFGVNRFLTQKLSWSLVNKFPHHTFFWEGIDGSCVLAHFPPGDSYEMSGKAEELLRTVRNFRDKGRSNRSAFLFGHGDGGHGPSEEMLERLSRFKDCDGLPKVEFAGSDKFFSDVENENSKLLCRWRGELYLEMHNGTYTTWGQVKKGNRQCEILLVELETFCTVASLRNEKWAYPYEEIERLWKLLLLNQFHDILPGSSITMEHFIPLTSLNSGVNEYLARGWWYVLNKAAPLKAPEGVEMVAECNGLPWINDVQLVFKDAMKNYKVIRETTSKIFEEAMTAIIHKNCKRPSSGRLCQYIVNSQAFARTELVDVMMMEELESPVNKKRRTSGAAYNNEKVIVSLPPMSIIPIKDCQTKTRLGGYTPIVISKEEDNIVLKNNFIKAVIDPLGRVVSLVCFDKKKGRWSKEAIDSDHPANQFLLYDDLPLYWDAWDVMDYHMETRNPVIDPIQRMVVSDNSSDLQVVLEVSLKISNQSYLRQEIIFDAVSPYIRFNTEVTWGENRKLLKVEVPTTVHSMEATYEIQSGFLRRPNHFNTSWDSARYEVCGHKWADISEYDFGVAIMNDCKYGHSAVDGIIRLSLLKSSKNPDPKADMGVHTFSYAIMPHMGTFQEAGLIQQALAFNAPLKNVIQSIPHVPSETGVASVFSIVNCPGVVIQATKMAEDKTKNIILRLHEAFGGNCDAVIRSILPLTGVVACNGLEQPLDGISVVLTKEDPGTKISLRLSAFQIVSLRCSLA